MRGTGCCRRVRRDAYCLSFPTNLNRIETVHACMHFHLCLLLHYFVLLLHAFALSLRVLTTASNSQPSLYPSASTKFPDKCRSSPGLCILRCARWLAGLCLSGKLSCNSSSSICSSSSSISRTQAVVGCMYIPQPST